MNMFEEAQALHTMMKMCRITQRELAARLGTSQSYVANKLRLLSLPDSVRALILERGLCERHARAILRLKSEEQLCEAVMKISAMRLTAQEAEALAEEMDIKERIKKIRPHTERESIELFMEILNSSLLQLKSCGVRVEKYTDIGERRSYITLCIEG